MTTLGPGGWLGKGNVGRSFRRSDAGLKIGQMSLDVEGASCWRSRTQYNRYMQMMTTYLGT